MSSPAARVAAELERRAARAELLRGEAPAAEEVLAFAAGLYRAQARVAEGLSKSLLTGRLEEDAATLVAKIAPLLHFVSDAGPEGLADEARELRSADRPAVRALLLAYWQAERPPADDYLPRAILRPYAELLRGLEIRPDRPHERGTCPFCGGAPWISARRDGSAMEGARRSLGCALCGHEWPFERIRCPACFEEDPVRLPSFRDAGHPRVRIEACESCRRYIKSIDLSEDARPIPEVDDLVSLAMDLWAHGEALTRIEPGLAGI